MMRSFTVTCDKCGGSATFRHEDRRYKSEIELDVELRGDYAVDIDNIVIYCENLDCPNWVDIKY